MPNLPNSMHPDRKEWLRFTEDLVRNMKFSELTIVAHSLSVATALDLIVKKDKRLGCLVSISGFGRDYRDNLNNYFMIEREIDFKKVKQLIGRVYVIYGDDDPYVPQDILKDLADELGVVPVIIANGGHLNTDSGYSEFPLLLKLLEEK